MCVTTNQHVAVQLAAYCSQSFSVAPWHNLVPVDQTDLELTDFDHFSFREWLLIKVAFHKVCLRLRGGQVFQPFVDLQNKEISCLITNVQNTAGIIFYLPL